MFCKCFITGSRLDILSFPDPVEMPVLDRRTEFTRLRECAGLSIEEAAQLLHVTERTIRRYETPGSRGTDPSPLAMDFVRRMAQASARANFVDRKKPTFRFIDLFAGIGGAPAEV